VTKCESPCIDGFRGWCCQRGLEDCRCEMEGLEDRIPGRDCPYAERVLCYEFCERRHD